MQKIDKNNKSEKKETMVSEQFTEANKWELLSFNGEVPDKVGFDKRIPLIVIDFGKSRIAGNSGCNSFGGEAIIEGNTIRVDKVMSTKMYCAGVPEHEFFRILQQPLQFKIEGDVLKLKTDDVVVLEFRLQKNDEK